MMVTRLKAQDQDLQALLETRERLLGEVVAEAIKYRAMLRPLLRRLWHGADPGLTRAAVELWDVNLRKIKRLMREL